MKLKITGYSTDNNTGTEPQSIDLKEIMLIADAKALRGLAEFSGDLMMRLKPMVKT